MDAAVAAGFYVAGVEREIAVLAMLQHKPAVRMKDSGRKDLVRDGLEIVQRIRRIGEDNVKLFGT